MLAHVPFQKGQMPVQWYLIYIASFAAAPAPASPLDPRME